MKIMMKKTGDENWTPIDSRDYKLEKEWQDMIVENPSLIPIVDICQGSTALVLAIDPHKSYETGRTLPLLCLSMH